MLNEAKQLIIIPIPKLMVRLFIAQLSHAIINLQVHKLVPSENNLLLPGKINIHQGE